MSTMPQQPDPDIVPGTSRPIPVDPQPDPDVPTPEVDNPD